MTTWNFPYPLTGQTIYAYPLDRVAYPLSSWTTHRVLMTESNKLYECDIDISKSARWVAFVGASQPADYNLAIYEEAFAAADTISGAVAVNITPATFSQINRGDKSNIFLLYKEVKNVVIPVPGDYRAIPIYFVVEDANKANVYTRTDGQLTKAETSVSVTIDTTITNILTEYLWSLRRVSNDEVLVYGGLKVSYAAF